MTPSPRIALIHAVQVAIGPIQDAFAAEWPEARPFNLLDDALSADRERSAELSADVVLRIVALANYAQSAGAAGILYTCSAFGPAIEAARAAARVPVLKPNEAMFDEALRCGADIAMLATFAPSVASMEEEFVQAASAAGTSAKIRTVCVPEAMRALKAGDAATHDALLARAARSLGDADALLLAHFSTSRARSSVEAAVGRPVLTAPGSAVRALRRSMARGSLRD